MVFNKNNYPSKLLLFGEYGILLGLDALAIPLTIYNGKLDFGSKNADNDLLLFLAYLKKIKPTMPFDFHIDELEADIKKGLRFKSNIPLNYGLGSSGALVAAVFEKYAEPSKKNPKFDIRALKTILALIESHFHGQSSGIDPLVSLIKQPILVRKSGNIVSINRKILPPKRKLRLFLLDSRLSGKTGNLVKQFMDRMKEQDFSDSFRNAYSNFSNAAISNLLNGKYNEFISCFSELSEFQLNEMSELIPGNIQKYFKLGISSGNYYLKLCGSGGGGYFLGVTKNKESVEKLIKAPLIFL